jgi:hypothetical protein
MAAAATAAQAQALQYANRFVELRDAIESGDVRKARQTLFDFQRVAAASASTGLDPIRQIPVLAENFGRMRDSLLKGDLQAARDSLATLKRGLGLLQPTSVSASPSTDKAPQRAPEPKSKVQKTVRTAASEPSRNRESIILESLGFLGADEELLREAHSMRSSTPLKSPADTSSTFIRVRPELTSFAQKSQVFPTSTASLAELALPTANTSTQAQVVVQGLAATQPNAQLVDLDGTAYAPTPELLLGSKGMTIPPGAELRFANNPTLLQRLSFGI